MKRLWDEDTRDRRRLRIVLLGSAPLLMQRGLTESLAGRFELLHLMHWTAAEMRDAFGWSIEQFVFYGGYPGAAFSAMFRPGRTLLAGDGIAIDEFLTKPVETWVRT